jgi:hypothetical protein
MSSSNGNIAINPAIRGNLRGLAEVALEIQTELSQLPSLYCRLDSRSLREETESRFTQAGLKIRNDAPAKFIVAIATQLTLHSSSALYAIDTVLREAVLLPRTGVDPQDSSDFRWVDSWRHKESSGIFLPQTSVRNASDLLRGECYRHTDNFINAWLRDQDNRVPPPPYTPPEPPAPPAEPQTDTLKKVKSALEAALNGLALGNKGSASLDKFDVAGSKVDFKARVRHRQVNNTPLGKVTLFDVTTHAEGSFDITDPASLKFQVCVDKPSIAGGGKICLPIDLSGI